MTVSLWSDADRERLTEEWIALEYPHGYPVMEPQSSLADYVPIFEARTVSPV